MCLGAIYWARPDAVYFACTATMPPQPALTTIYLRRALHDRTVERKVPMVQPASRRRPCSFSELDRKDRQDRILTIRMSNTLFLPAARPGRRGDDADAGRDQIIKWRLLWIARPCGVHFVFCRHGWIVRLRLGVRRPARESVRA